MKAGSKDRLDYLLGFKTGTAGRQSNKRKAKGKGRKNRARRKS